MSDVKLKVPYRSQWDADAKDHKADCGPACLAMILNALGDPITPDELYRYIGERGVNEYTSFTDLRNAARKRANLTTTRRNFFPTRAIKDARKTIDAGKPFVALVNYAYWDGFLHNGFKGSHFVVVVGYNEKHIIAHDPLFRGSRRNLGAYHAFTNAQFSQAWGGFSVNQNPNYAVLIAEARVPFVDETPVAEVPKAGFTYHGRVEPELARRMRAYTAYHGMQQPNLEVPRVVEHLRREMGSFGEQWDTYTMRPGVTLVRVAEVFYGDGQRWPAIAYFNELIDPNALANGQVVRVPRLDMGERLDARVPRHGFGGPEG